MPYQVDDRPFFEILHTLLRHDDDAIAMGQVEEVMDWFQKHLIRIKTVFRGGEGAEWELYQAVFGYYLDHHEAPSRDALPGLIVQQGDKTKALLDLVEAYETLEADLKIIRAGDLNVPLEARVQDYERYKVNQTLSQANAIALGSWQPKDKREKQLSGPRDAINFFIEKVQSGILVGQEQMVGGVLAKTADGLPGRYEAAEADRKANKLFIKTGIEWIDAQLGGLRRKEMSGILGYTGQRKSMVARSIAYNAAAAGHFVLHIPFESSYEEEELFYASFHSLAVDKATKISPKAVTRGQLTQKQNEDYCKRIVPRFKVEVAPNIAVYKPAFRTWAEVRSIIERVNFQRKLDLVIVDYLTLLSTPGAKDDIADKTLTVQEAKQLCMDLNEEGVALVSPIQGNRAGWEEAAANDGNWELTGIFKYSEVEKSLDNCFSVWFNDDLGKSGEIKMGAPKSRRDGLQRARNVSFDPVTGLVGVPSTSGGNGSGVTSTNIDTETNYCDAYGPFTGTGKYVE
jgi:hypothetical protein